VGNYDIGTEKIASKAAESLWQWRMPSPPKPAPASHSGGFFASLTGFDDPGDAGYVLLYGCYPSVTPAIGAIF